MSRPERIAPFALAALLTLSASPPFRAARAETADPSKLESLKQELDNSVERKKALQAQSESTRKEVEEIRSRLIETAANVQAREKDVSASEERLAALKTAEAELLARLEHRRDEMANLLAALTRLDRHPPPALAVHPDDALGAIRSAILLGSAVPELRAEAMALKEKLDELTRLRQSIMAERTTLADAKASLERDKARLETLLDRKVARQQKLAEAAESEQARAQRLSREATDLNDLIGRLEATAAARIPQPRPDPATLRAAVPEPAAPASQVANATSDEATRPERQAALTPPREGPALPSSRLFSEAKGLIQLPAAGPVMREFGAPNGLGGRMQGLQIATRPEAQVIAPFDGRIVFAGPFRRYGQLLIISVGEGYHVLLAGMNRINGMAGQSVLAGEPVGTMGPTPSPDSLAEDSGTTGRDGGPGTGVKTGLRPMLYIEFRKDGDPIDPRPWLMMSDKKARG
ncbi:murein hydrolase activator EnvC family protein [Parvibaculum sp.]|uniref:murein hydrolase activator EnvC family protein n=1 Tax=Parvibaculum sp. TaxID=2024848 RepID=UPI002BC7B353|nr:peptidoglycan DD-metalloendopeptidase family protein [Parvibaculum sp.]HUD51671.1 peptidoglycan DD-metalloendopeptidase family protein [Parvibaculum sp.]